MSFSIAVKRLVSLDSRQAFVAIGLGVNAIVLARGLILMLALEYADLGFVALVQAAMAFVGMLHFGLLNGGYRLLCHAGPRTRQRIIDLAYTGFAAITACLGVVGLAVCVALGDWAMTTIALLSIIGGVGTLMRSWMMNEMVAWQRLRAANIINAASILVSMTVLLLLVPHDRGLSPAIIAAGAIVIQPVAFAALALLSGAVLRPRAWRASGRLCRLVFRAGFSLFLASVALQSIPLIERAYVSGELGLEALGHLYLAFLFVTLFQMVPNLVQQVFLAPVIERWRAGDIPAVRSELRTFLWVTMIYCGATALGLWLLAEHVLMAILPQYLPDLRWVHTLAPGLIAFALAGPFTLSYNVMITHRWYLIAYIGGAVMTAFVFVVAVLEGTTLTLEQVVMWRSAMFAAMGLTLVIGAYRLTKRASEFRFLGPTPAQPATPR